MSVDAEIQTRIAENIALLHYLGELPCVDLPPSSWRDMNPSEHVLSLDVEQELASDFAFLSSVRDDIYKISAVAIQEVCGSSLHILVAANATLDSSNAGYLEEVRSGFEAICEIMGRASCTSRQQLQLELLRAIVRLCRDRILERTKIPKPSSGSANEPSLSDRLHDISEILRVLGNTPERRILDRLVSDLHPKLSQIARLVRDESVDETELDEAIMTAIDACRDTAQILEEESFLTDKRTYILPKYDPGLARSIHDKIRKIGRYARCAERLGKLARRHEILQHMKARCVALDDQSLQHICPTSTPTTEQTILGRTTSSEVDLARLRERRAAYNPKTRLFRESWRLARGSSARIHAEIQLLWYLDSHSPGPSPRVIESNKMACFLCSALISSSGRYAVSRSHDKIYPGWRLPSTQLDDGLHEKFARYLEQFTAICVDSLLAEEPPPRRRAAVCESCVTLYRDNVESILTMSELLNDEDDAGSDTSVETIKGFNMANTLATSDTSSASNVSRSEDEWIAIPSGSAIWVQSSEELRILIEHEGPSGEGQAPRQVRVRRLSDTEAAHLRREQYVYDLREDLKSGKPRDCGKGCKSVVMQLDGAVFLVEMRASASSDG